MEIQEALNEIRKQKKRKFNQTVELIINLKKINLKKDNINTIIRLPNKYKEKKICGFLTKKSPLIDVILPNEFQKYKDKKLLKKLAKEYDFFLAFVQLMPSIAGTFGKVLGPSGKMPSPQLGILTKEDDATIKENIEKINLSIKINVKEMSIKAPVGKESMQDKELIENILAFYKGIVEVLPTKKENIRSIMIKTTMGKPVKFEIK